MDIWDIHFLLVLLFISVFINTYRATVTIFLDMSYLYIGNLVFCLSWMGDGRWECRLLMAGERVQLASERVRPLVGDFCPHLQTW